MGETRAGHGVAQLIIPFSDEEAGDPSSHTPRPFPFYSQPATLGVRTHLAKAKGPPAGELKEISQDLPEIGHQKEQSRMLAQRVSSDPGLPEFKSQVWSLTVGLGTSDKLLNLYDPGSSSVKWEEQQKIPWGWVCKEVVGINKAFGTGPPCSKCSVSTGCSHGGCDSLQEAGHCSG